MTFLRPILADLYQQRAALQKYLQTLEEAVAVLGVLGRAGRPAPTRKARKTSAAGRVRIVSAKRARGAKSRRVKKGKPVQFVVTMAADHSKDLDALVVATERWLKRAGASIVEHGRDDEDLSVSMIVQAKKDIRMKLAEEGFPGKVTIDPLDS